MRTNSFFWSSDVLISLGSDVAKEWRFSESTSVKLCVLLPQLWFLLDTSARASSHLQGDMVHPTSSESFHIMQNFIYDYEKPF